MALSKEEKWNAIVHCDNAYDGLFLYGVKTTGIFCRPSCKSKEPKKNNVEFFDGIEEAYSNGLRPCKRCRPDLIEFNPMLALIKKTKNIFDTYFDDREKLSAEVKELAVSQNHLIYLFRQQFHVTPIEYINQLRIKKAMHLLINSDMNILNIALSCGFGSLSNFYEFFKRQAKLTPSNYRKQWCGDTK